MEENVSTQGIQYDYRSVMHLHFDAFAKKYLRSIVKLKRFGLLRSTHFPTVLDMLHLVILYCQGMCETVLSINNEL